MVTTPAADPMAANAAALERDLGWLGEVIVERVADPDGSAAAVLTRLPPPDLDGDASIFATFVRHYELDPAERLTVVLALAPHVRPELLDPFFGQSAASGRGYTEYGGVNGRVHGGFLPTGETVQFLLAGADLERRLDSQQLFDRDHFFAQHDILRLEPAPAGEPLVAGPLVLADEIVDYLTTGRLRKPDYSRDFPAKLITTEMEWSDLVLPPSTLDQLRELEAWIRHERELMEDWGLARRLRPGYTSLFYGPPGTGKTLTATLLGKRVDRDVYRIALSSVVSKYIGETEKNLERVFDRAERMECILFFDEADALFGKRTSVGDAHDRYANQEISYLLQRVEDFEGVVILASNFRSLIDDAFNRRFQSVVHFPVPDAGARERLWRASLSPRSRLEDGADIGAIAREYELTGGAIMNVVRYVSLMALSEGSNVIRGRELVGGIRRELQKEGKTL
ncbi:MAG: ATP-binding protein [Ilumatobacter sp.]|uniref:ATP-binding protein n=1 Tax=Ilumatobacter sp. TaxID=1967498 RepID=UPI002623298E|nr:ATP-binding protein [Ilumatobacter sp.]MDJ0768456.1 ATP-binding protein [Ilumatobacter sp.]